MTLRVELSTADPRGLGFLAGGGELGARMRAFDWASSPLGPAETWPQSLRTAVRIMLTSRQPIWIGWGEGLIYLYNDAYKSIIGGKHPWALGKPTADVWPEISSDIGPLLETAMSGEGAYVEEQLLIMERHGYPEETYYTFSYSPIPDDDGRPGGIICANTDDTQRVIGERQLALLREVAAETVDVASAREACERATRALSSNPRDVVFGLLYLAPPEATTADLLASCGLPAGHPAAPASLALDDNGSWPIAAALRDGQVCLVDNLVARFGPLSQGVWERPPTQAAILPILTTGEGGRGGALIVGLNPYRLFDDGYRGFLELAAGQIAAAVASAETREEERRRAEALAELDRAKTAFFSNVSHEFRTPLTLMLGPLEDVLNNAGPTEAVRGPLRLAHRNGVRLLRLVNSLLDFSRIEAGRVRATYEPTDLATFTGEIASSFRSTVERAGLAFEVSCDPLPRPVFVDRDMWEKVVLNLISNAFKFTFEGEIRVRLEQAADGRGAVLTVADSGIGIPAAEAPRLFERFHRVEGARGRSFEGSGIGLALVHELVKLHGGEIAVESVEGQGAAFRVSLPFGRAHLPADHVRDEAQAGAPSAARAQEYVEEALRWLPGLETSLEGGETLATEGLAAAPSEGPSPGGGKRVLLADDNADMRAYVRRLLQEHGYEVEAVEDGERALAAARRAPPDLILTDVMMPKLDGFGLLRALRADPATASAPVIVLSARAGEEAKVEGLDSGADDYLVKPFAARELLARVNANIQLAHVRGAAEAEIRSRQAALEEQTRALQILNRAAAAISGDLDLERLVQTIVDAGVEVTGAQFGAFFYNIVDAAGERYTLYTLSGAPREAFSSFPIPRNTAVFAPTFSGAEIVRSDDITLDPRYGRSGPHHGMPKGHLLVRSYLAVPVKSRTGEVLGGLFFGHADRGVFGDSAEERIVALASQAAVAMDNAALFQSAERELERRRRAEGELQALNVGLEQRVATEVAERAKAEEALRQAQKMEAVGQLTGGVAHDFNNLLTVIIGGLDTIRRAEPADQARVRRAADMALQGAQRAANLTSRLLAFSRRQPLAPRPIDLNLLVRDMTELLHRTLGEQIELEGVLAPRLWRIEADQNQLEAAILNLAVNARDAMPEGGKLTIETANTALDETYTATDAEVIPGQYVQICVSDTGQGMSEDTVGRVFEPFFTTKEVGRGTGLGLSMVYGFVKQSGGHVTIYSEEGQGTTVKLYFPRYSGEARSMPSPEAEPVPMGSRDEVVLVVEDNDDVRTYSVMILKELGYQVLEAANADAAVEVLKASRRIDLLFTDVVLPGASGRALADTAAKLRPKLKVLFTTGYSRNAIVHHGRLDPGVQLISKPFTFEQLAGRVRDILDMP